MRKPNKMRWLLFAASFSCLISCAVSPPDVFVFEPLSQRLVTDPKTGHLMLEPSPTCMRRIAEPECGHGISIVSGNEVLVGSRPENLWRGKTWLQIQQHSVYVPAEESYAPLAAYVIDSCKKMNCNDEVTRFRVKLDSLNGIAGALKNH